MILIGLITLIILILIVIILLIILLIFLTKIIPAEAILTILILIQWETIKISLIIMKLITMNK